MDRACCFWWIKLLYFIRPISCNRLGCDFWKIFSVIYSKISSSAKWRKSSNAEKTQAQRVSCLGHHLVLRNSDILCTTLKTVWKFDPKATGSTYLRYCMYHWYTPLKIMVIKKCFHFIFHLKNYCEHPYQQYWYRNLRNLCQQLFCSWL